MADSSNAASVLNTALAALPHVLEIIRAKHAEDNPGAPPLTDAEVIAGLHAAVTSSLAQDDAIEADVRARNPPTQNPTT